MSLELVRETVPTGTVEGRVEPRFRPVLDRFLENFRSAGEVGAGLCVIHEGETVLDVWGGAADPRDTVPWTDETISCVFSCTKGAIAVVANMLVDRGLLDLDALVTDYWPEYGQSGKERTTVRMMLDHTAGVPAFRDDLPEGALLDWDYATRTLAAQAPYFVPGTRSSYHGLTYAWTIGEVIRRVAGKPASRFFAEEVAGPLGLDFWIGLPDDQEPRVARMIKPKLDPSVPASQFVLDLKDKASIPARFYLNDGGFNPNKRDYRAVEIGSANGVANARALARLYTPFTLGGTFEGVRLVSPERIDKMRRITNATHDDATLRLPMRFGAGFMRSADNRHVKNPPASGAILGEGAFGHVGSGGSIGFADPEAGFAFGYAMNQMGLGQMLNARGQSLVDAVYGVLSAAA